MSTQWYYQVRGGELGPLPCRELVRLVRAGRIAEEDLVRGAHLPDWQPAGSVVGLFYMARHHASWTEWGETAAVGERQTNRSEKPASESSSDSVMDCVDCSRPVVHVEADDPRAEDAVDRRLVETLEDALAHIDRRSH